MNASIVTTVTIVTATVGAMGPFGMLGFLLSIPLGVATYFVLRTTGRRRLIAKMGPALATSTGELLPPREREDSFFTPAGDDGRYLGSITDL